VTAFSAVPAATASCTAIVLDSVVVPGNKTLDLSKLKTGTAVTFAGTTTFEFFEADYDTIKVGGTDITITAEPDAVIDGNGQAWWDGQGSNGGIEKPDHFFVISKLLGNSIVKDLYIQNYPTHCFSISNSAGLVLENIVLNNTAGNAPNNRSGGLPAAHNTDGFDLSSCNNTIVRNSVVLNQDDCVAITSGNNITVSGMHCDGSHGKSRKQDI
jgi:polygalacturonase